MAGESRVGLSLLAVSADSMKCLLTILTAVTLTAIVSYHLGIDMCIRREGEH